MSLTKVLRIQRAFEKRAGIETTNRKISSGGTVDGVKIALRLSGVKDISSVEAAATSADGRNIRYADKTDKEDVSAGEVSPAHAVAALLTLRDSAAMLGVVADADQDAGKTAPPVAE